MYLPGGAGGEIFNAAVEVGEGLACSGMTRLWRTDEDEDVDQDGDYARWKG